MKKLTFRTLITLACTGFVAVCLATASLAWFTMPGGQTDKETLDGEVGLRGYFYTGDGSENNPFEIVSPNHFYNLTRLQNLGVFPEKRYFRMGHIFDGDTLPSCINRYDSEGNPIKEHFLDMGAFSSQTKILPIGGEGAPFVGNFNGYGIPIRNLKVQGNPEDIGVFGYVSYEGYIEGLVCDNLEVHSLGYTNNPSDDSTELFGQDIDDIFTSAAEKYMAKETSLTFYDNEDLGNEEKQLKHLNGLNPTGISDINSVEKLISSTSTVYNGYFLPTYPTSGNDNFTYSWKSSSSILRKCTVEDKTNGLEISDDDISKAIVIDMESLKTSSSDPTDNGFNSGKDMQVDARLSLIANVQIGGYKYSRVIQSYKVEFYSNSTGWNEGEYSLSIFCDYVDTGSTTDRPTNYHHGNNIGFLAGHVDGTITNSFVYRGRLFFNDSQYCHEINTESQTGLIGEIGTNVINSLDPDFGLTVHGDTGVMNFTKIYGNIRGDFSPGDIMYGGYQDSYYYVSYHAKRNLDTYDAESGMKYFDLFSQYLRHMAGTSTEYITSVSTGDGTVKHLDTGEASDWHQLNGVPDPVPNRYNSVDFLWNQVIQDENGKDRGLGVFKIVTSHNSNANESNYASHYLDNLGECYINNSDAKSKIYFSTAEYVHDSVKYPNQPVWGTGTGEIDPLRATNLPSYSDVHTFDYPFSRDYNYCFELNLAQSTGGKNYMYNTDSEFLTNYLQNILIDKYGGSINPGNPRFGFMFRSSENELLNGLSSYMPLGVPGGKEDFGSNGDHVYYPTNSIVFDIENDNGANVSVVANGADVSIYSYDPTTSSGGTTKMLTMKSGPATSVDSKRYFEYNATTGVTGTESVISADDMKDESALYAHIFKLPKGHYVIGASSGTARIYFLAVQGQTDATIGDNEQAAVGNAITDVDFLLAQPTLSAYPASLSKANFNFRSNFDDSRETQFTVDIKTVESTNYLSLLFIDNPRFVDYLLLNAYNLDDHVYYLNDVRTDRAQYVLPRD